MKATELVEKAIESGAGVEVVERLLGLAEKQERAEAQKAFQEALSGFQGDCPVIKKDKEVKNKSGGVRYWFAPLDSIVSQVGPLLKKYGLTYSVEDVPEANGIRVRVKITHKDGFSQASDFGVPIDPDAFMNEQQKVASAATFAKRNAFCNVLGIMTGDHDDDAQQVSGAVSAEDIYRRQAAYMESVWANRESIEAIKAGIESGDLSMAAEAWFELDTETKQALWMAHSKGGVFTTAERKMMQSSEFKAAHYGEEGAA